jgi:hypothetical protein
MSGRPSSNCDDLDFHLDYFRLETDWFDLEVVDFVEELPDYLDTWHESEEPESGRCDWTAVTTREIESFDIVAGTKARFILRHPCVSKGLVQFDLKIGDRGTIVGYEATEGVFD